MEACDAVDVHFFYSGWHLSNSLLCFVYMGTIIYNSVELRHMSLGMCSTWPLVSAVDRLQLKEQSKDRACDYATLGCLCQVDFISED
jgi:hypothetical protein